ncbi:hypothetical protein QUA30_16235 [Microcoleus sp. Pol14C2]|uniref:hypothetical protein n=1 Tax=unclassified Microcoleus TaxID=2642155 RepID=UPI002FD6F3C3
MRPGKPYYRKSGHGSDVSLQIGRLLHPIARSPGTRQATIILEHCRVLHIPVVDRYIRSRIQLFWGRKTALPSPQ